MKAVMYAFKFHSFFFLFADYVVYINSIDHTRGYTKKFVSIIVYKCELIAVCTYVMRFHAELYTVKKNKAIQSFDRFCTNSYIILI